jgi:hypothetical protein
MVILDDLRTATLVFGLAWKACEGQPFRSSNLLSSAPLTCKNSTFRKPRAGPGTPVVSNSGLNCELRDRGWRAPTARKVITERGNHEAENARRPAVRRRRQAVDVFAMSHIDLDDMSAAVLAGGALPALGHAAGARSSQSGSRWALIAMSPSAAMRE